MLRGGLLNNIKSTRCILRCTLYFVHYTRVLYRIINKLYPTVLCILYRRLEIKYCTTAFDRGSIITSLNCTQKYTYSLIFYILLAEVPGVVCGIKKKSIFGKKAFFIFLPMGFLKNFHQ